MQTAERLYTQGYISYPRTETTQYPENFDFRSALQSQRSHRDWGAYVTELLNKGIAQPRKGKDVGDHPPITPMRSATANELGLLGYAGVPLQWSSTNLKYSLFCIARF